MPTPAAPAGRYISIHALREEGDLLMRITLPSSFRISIHALREEGDLVNNCSLVGHKISIHALREEGDEHNRPHPLRLRHFYPRPPRGGRQFSLVCVS